MSTRRLPSAPAVPIPRRASGSTRGAVAGIAVLVLSLGLAGCQALAPDPPPFRVSETGPGHAPSEPGFRVTLTAGDDRVVGRARLSSGGVRVFDAESVRVARLARKESGWALLQRDGATRCVTEGDPPTRLVCDESIAVGWRTDGATLHLTVGDRAFASVVDRADGTASLQTAEGTRWDVRPREGGAFDVLHQDRVVRSLRGPWRDPVGAAVASLELPVPEDLRWPVAVGVAWLARPWSTAIGAGTIDGSGSNDGSGASATPGTDLPLVTPDTDPPNGAVTGTPVGTPASPPASSAGVPEGSGRDNPTAGSGATANQAPGPLTEPTPGSGRP